MALRCARWKASQYGRILDAPVSRSDVIEPEPKEVLSARKLGRQQEGVLTH
jgi:hypothetical protein